jgi:D-glycero-D-manno-heptose 1,7-bisphosphate phosphatase
MRQRAVFLDRDGTINADTAYVASPDAVRLLAGAGRAVGRLNRAGWRVMVVSNQSGLARGHFDEAALAATNARLRELLAAEGAALDAIYVCPHLAEGATVPRYAGECDCRKPAAGLLRRAAEHWGLDLAACWMVGDAVRDVEAGRAAGCRTILLGGTACPHADRAATNLDEAVGIILGEDAQ